MKTNATQQDQLWVEFKHIPVVFTSISGNTMTFVNVEEGVRISGTIDRTTVIFAHNTLLDVSVQLNDCVIVKI